MRPRMWSLALLVLCVAPAPLLAQFSVQYFQPSPHARDYLSVEGSEVNEHLLPSAQLLVNYMAKPLVFVSDTRPDQAVVDKMLTMDVLFSMSFYKWFELGLDVPFMPFVDGDGTGGSIVALPDVDAISLGDIRFSGKVTMLKHEKSGFGLAADLGMTFPTARDVSFAGEESVTFLPKLIAELNFSDYRVAINAGYRLRKNQTLSFLHVNDEILLGAAVSVPLGIKTLTAIGEIQTASEAANYFADKNTSYVEGDLALRYIAPFGLAATLGGGGGFLRGLANPQYRIIAGIGYVPLKAPPKDRDKDGILDKDDLCPDDPEDIDGYKDSDGCPDPDNDNDGILDVTDKCPTKAEDVDGFEDADGCPDEDNDGDGVPDARDRCPDDPEDRDGFEDADGCVDPDNDGDGTLDAADKCPNEPETVNEYQDEDGCPDTPPTVFITKDKIVITQKVFFQKGTDIILKKSRPVLDSVATILAENPQILKISVEGHTSTEGSDKNNKRLSEKRAASIVRYLVGKKVAKDRLQSKGWGEEKPLTQVPEANEEQRETNRRVEFLILQTK